MSAASDYLEDRILNWLRGTAFPAAPGTLYLALFTAAPSDAGGGTEVSGGSYARRPIALAAGNPALNSAKINFALATAAWGTITHVGIFDAAAGGNLLVWSALTASRNVAVSERLVFEAGQVAITAA